jgi:hypothetical protein
MDSITIPFTVAATGAVGILVYVVKVAVEEHLKDRRAKREAFQKTADAQAAAFNAHVTECQLRAETHKRLEEKFDEMKLVLQALSGKVDRLVVQVTESATRLESHIEEDERFQTRVQEAIG